MFLEHLELAIEYQQQVPIHTPHLEDKYQGTRMILDMLCDDSSRIDPTRVLVDCVEEHTISEVLDRGFWGWDDTLPRYQMHATASRRYD